MEVVSGDNWSYKSCKAPVKSSPPTNQHPVFLQAGCPCCRLTNSQQSWLYLLLLQLLRGRIHFFRWVIIPKDIDTSSLYNNNFTCSLHQTSLLRWRSGNSSKLSVLHCSPHRYQKDKVTNSTVYWWWSLTVVGRQQKLGCTNIAYSVDTVADIRSKPANWGGLKILGSAHLHFGQVTCNHYYNCYLR